MTLKKFAVDYSKIKNDAPKVRVLNCLQAMMHMLEFDDITRGSLISLRIRAAAKSLDGSSHAYAHDRTIALSPKIAALYHIHAAVELVRRLKKDSKPVEKGSKAEKVSWFRDYYEYTGLLVRSNSTTKYYVELHIGAHGWQTWQMLLALGYTPDQDAFWLELDSFISAPLAQAVELENVDSTLFLEMM